ncbi:MAG TPA: hypothetical protein VM074_04425 [Solimonas sp.]|nr:hypothetical protein [Solimonas sp.]
MAAAKRLWYLLRGRPPGDEPKHESFLAYRDAGYLRLAVLLCLGCIVAYALHDPYGGPAGNTPLGYTLGGLGACIILWLTWFGVRKRKFHAGAGTARGWLSAHVYLGLALLVIVTLHTGLRMSANVHTLAYVLMVLVSASGLYGVVAYSTVPSAITKNRQQMELKAMLMQVSQLDETALALADRIDAETHAVVVRSIRKVRIGGSAWEQLSGNYRAPADTGEVEQFVQLKRGQLASGQAPEQEGGRGGRRSTIAFVADHIFDAGRDQHGESLQKLLATIAQRKELVERINRDITLRARLSFWLYLHVPLTVALLGALVVHVLTVFLYW